jgi:hypothetical protein
LAEIHLFLFVVAPSREIVVRTPFLIEKECASALHPSDVRKNMPAFAAQLLFGTGSIP